MVAVFGDRSYCDWGCIVMVAVFMIAAVFGDELYLVMGCLCDCGRIVVVAAL